MHRAWQWSRSYIHMTTLPSIKSSSMLWERNCGKELRKNMRSNPSFEQHYIADLAMLHILHFLPDHDTTPATMCDSNSVTYACTHTKDKLVRRCYWTDSSTPEKRPGTEPIPKLDLSRKCRMPEFRRNLRILRRGNVIRYLSATPMLLLIPPLSSITSRQTRSETRLRMKKHNSSRWFHLLSNAKSSLNRSADKLSMLQSSQSKKWDSADVMKEIQRLSHQINQVEGDSDWLPS